ncbi:MAG: type II toxin-antitoxin system HicA family toxin [Tepidisphaeraceae bacterium]
MPSPVRYSEVKRYMEQRGWSFSHVTGSHHVFKKPGERSFPIPVHHGQVNHVYFREIKKLCEGR